MSDYFLSEGAFYVSIMTALLTGTPSENWRVLDPNSALLSHGLMAKVEAGAARIFRYDGAGWKDTTTDTVAAIRDSLAKRMAPAPTLNVTAHGYRVTVRIAAGTTHRGPFKLYFNRTRGIRHIRGLHLDLDSRGPVLGPPRELHAHGNL